MCISFRSSKVSSVQPKYHESRYTEVKAIDVTHSTDINFDHNDSAVMKCQDIFKFKVTNYNTFAPKIYTKFLEFTI